MRPDGSNSRVHPRLGQAGKKAGINFTGLTDRAPNTRASHVALDYAFAAGGATAQNELSEALFKAYFTDGVFLDAVSVAKIAGNVEGLSEDAARKAIEDPLLNSKIQKEATRFSHSGISGVPFFFINGKPAFSGAQPPSAFAEAFKLLAK